MVCIQQDIKYSLLTQYNREPCIVLVRYTATDICTVRVYRQQRIVIMFDDGLNVDTITWPVIQITASLK
jgi:hypothetical protein